MLDSISYFCGVKKYLLNIFIIISLASWGQKDTLDYTITRWTLDDYQNKINLPIDSFLEGSQIYNPIYNQDFSQAFNGNTGQAYQNTYYLNRKEQPFLFFRPYSAYLFLPENNKFYNTKQQYTLFQYVTNMSKDNNMQNVDLLHSQNITPYLNLGFEYRLLGANGEYKSQKTSNHFFRAFGSYESKNYNAFLVYNYNKFNSYLNGGLTSDTLLDNPNNTIKDTKLLPVYLENSKNAILGRNINLRHHYTFYKTVEIPLTDSLSPKLTTDSSIVRENISHQPLFRIGHELDWNYNKRIYSNQGSPGFYQETFIDTSALTGGFVSDSTGYSNFNNTFFINLIDDSTNQSLPSIYLSYENSQEFFHSYNDSRSHMNHIISLMISNPVYYKWFWNFNAKYTLLGAYQGDFNINGTVQKFFGLQNQHSIRFHALFSQTSPNIFTQFYNSNFYKWNHAFDEKFALSTFDFSYRNKPLKLEVGIRQAYLDNYVYFASKMDSIENTEGSKSWSKIDGYPFQETSTFGILTFYLNHRLDIGPFHMLNSVTYQKISNDSVLHIPDLTFYNSSYFQMHFFKQVLMVQIGADTRYNSAYLADGFMPATGLFYNQYEKKLGAYPYIDFFINLKLKRARIFFKMEHINKGLNGNQYYTTYAHPMNPRVFRFGLSWRFWN